MFRRKVKTNRSLGCIIVDGGLFLSACISKYSRHSKRRCASGNIRTATGHLDPASKPRRRPSRSWKNSKGLVWMAGTDADRFRASRIFWAERRHPRTKDRTLEAVHHCLWRQQSLHGLGRTTEGTFTKRLILASETQRRAEALKQKQNTVSIESETASVTQQQASPPLKAPADPKAEKLWKRYQLALKNLPSAARIRRNLSEQSPKIPIMPFCWLPRN